MWCSWSLIGNLVWSAITIRLCFQITIRSRSPYFWLVCIDSHKVLCRRFSLVTIVILHIVFEMSHQIGSFGSSYIINRLHFGQFVTLVFLVHCQCDLFLFWIILEIVSVVFFKISFNLSIIVITIDRYWSRLNAYYIA